MTISSHYFMLLCVIVSHLLLLTSAAPLSTPKTTPLSGLPVDLFQQHARAPHGIKNTAKFVSSAEMKRQAGLSSFQDMCGFSTDDEFPKERNALIALYNATHGPLWSANSEHWLSSTVSYCCWGGIDCDSDSHVKSIVLMNSALSGVIPPDLIELPKLTGLVLSSANVAGAKVAINLFTATSNRIYKLPDNLGHWPSLTTLNLLGNPLESLPESISQLSNPLQTLALSGIAGLHFPASMSRVKINGNLDLSGMQFRTVPEWLLKMNKTNVMLLDLSFNELEHLPSELFDDMQNLDIFGCTHNQLTSLPDSFSKLRELSTLRLDLNLFETIPKVLCSLERLSDMNFQNNNLTTIPDCISDIPVLNQLTLRSNYLTTLPSLETSAIIQLDVTNNKLTSVQGIPHVIQVFMGDYNRISVANFSRCIDLATLTLSHNNLQSFPDLALDSVNPGIRPLSYLQLSYNNISHVPNATLVGSPQLTDLLLAYNRLQSFPFRGVPHSLVHLDLSFNNLRTLPFSASVIIPMPSLESLNISGNHLSQFYPALDYAMVRESFPQLSRLNISRNNLTTFEFSQVFYGQQGGGFSVLDISHNLLTFVELGFDIPIKFLLAHHNRIGSIRFIEQNVLPPESSYAGQVADSLAVLDLSSNELYEKTVAPKLSMWYISNLIGTSNVRMINFEHNPYIYRGIVDMQFITSDDAICFDMEWDTYTGNTGCLQWVPKRRGYYANPNLDPSDYSEWDAYVARYKDAGDAVVPDIYFHNSSVKPTDAFLECEYLEYTGFQPWIKPTSHGVSFSNVRISMDDSAARFHRCKLPVGSYPVFRDGHTLPVPEDVLATNAPYPIAAPRCPPSSYGHNPCSGGGRGVRQSVGGYRCETGYDESSYMCSRCVAGYVRVDTRCVPECSSTWHVFSLLVIVFAVVCVYVYLYFASFSSKRGSVKIIIFHAQMLAFLSVSLIPFPHMLHQHLFAFMHWSTVNPSGLICIDSLAPQNFGDILQYSVLTPAIAVFVLTPIVCLLIGLAWRFQLCSPTRLAGASSRDYDSFGSVPLLDRDMSTMAFGSNYVGNAVSRSQSESEREPEREPEPDSDAKHVAPDLQVEHQADEQFATASTSDMSDVLVFSSLDSKTTSLVYLAWKFNLFILYVLYAPLCVRVFQTFSSYSDRDFPSLPARLAFDLSVKYGSSEWKALLPYAISGLGLYVIGIPVLLWAATHGYVGKTAKLASVFLTSQYRNRELHDAHSVFDSTPTTPGPTHYDGVDSKSKRLTLACCVSFSRMLRKISDWFPTISSSNAELVYLGIKCIIAALIAFTSAQALVPIVVVIWLLILLTIFITRTQPYRWLSDNQRSVTSLSILQMTYVAGLINLQQSPDTTSDDTTTATISVQESSQTLVAWSILILNLGFFVWVFAAFVRHYLERQFARQQKEVQRELPF
jgi:leucine-rich repeat protein SHOC2